MGRRTWEAAQIERGQAGRMVNETNWPMPVSGLFSEAKYGRVRGELATTLMNFTSNGISIETRDGYAERSETAAIQRIPFEFGDDETYVEIHADRAEAAGAVYARAFTGNVMHTGISSHVIMADGAGPVLSYNGSVIAAAGFVTVDGKDPDEFDGVFSHQDRPYLWDSSELDFYYGDVGGVTGVLTKFPLSRLGNISGKIVIMESMTINAAHGMNDVLVIVTSTGWVILYEGLDPGDFNDWRLLGRVRVAAPVSRFAAHSFGSDLWFLTVRGLVSVRDSLANGVMALVSEVTKPVAKLIADEVKASKDLPGWQIITREDGDEVMMNVPVGDGFRQYAFRIDAPAWQTYDYPARWWHNLGGYTEFTGANGKLYRPAADIGDDGEPITMVWHSAWMRIPGRRELAYLIPTIIADGALTVKVTVLTDNNETPNDLEQAQQTITLEPENPGAGVSLQEIIAVNASGRSFQLRWEITGVGVEFVNLVAGLA